MSADTRASTERGGPSARVTASRDRLLRDAVAVGLAVGAYGIPFGAVAASAGLSVAQACALSLLAFTGASQFALVGVLGAGGTAIAGTAAALLLGARNGLYAMRLAPLLNAPRGWRRYVRAQGIIDETTAMALAHDASPADSRRAFRLTALAVYVCWNAGTLLGAAAGNLLADPRTLGLDAAAPAAFLALLAPRVRDRLDRGVAVGAVAVAVALTPLTPAGVPVLGAAAVALLGARR